MKLGTIEIWAIIAIIILIGILLLSGKGDFLIAGYNTMSAIEKKSYDIKKIRIVIGVGLLFLAGFIGLDNYNLVLAPGELPRATLLIFLIMFLLGRVVVKKGK